MHIYLCACVFCACQTACRPSRACPTESAVTAQSAETKPRGNITEPPAVTAAKASSDAPYARTTSTPAGTSKKQNKIYILEMCAHVTFPSSHRITACHITVCYSTPCKATYMITCPSYAGSAGSALWIKIRGTSVVSADSTNASEPG